MGCENRTALLTVMCTDMKYSVVLAYQTLYAQNIHRARLPSLRHEDETKHDNTVQFLKRLYICLAICGVGSSAEDNGDMTKPWPFPLATALAHGSRILISLQNIR